MTQMPSPIPSQVILDDVEEVIAVADAVTNNEPVSDLVPERYRAIVQVAERWCGIKPVGWIAMLVALAMCVVGLATALGVVKA